MKKNNNFFILSFCLLLVFISACTKTEEPPKPIGGKLPFDSTVNKSLAQLVDSIPEASIFSAAIKRTSIRRYMDSLAGKNPSGPYTMFVPTNKAWQDAGFTADNIGAVPVATLDTMIRYLTIPGGIPANTANLFGETNYYPITYRDRTITRSQVPSPFLSWTTMYYYYRIIVGMTDGVLRLNGKAVSKQAGISATNGTLYLLDSMVNKPYYESYQVLRYDTAFSFYMAALKKSNALYVAKGIIGQFNDTATLVLTVGSDQPGKEPFAITFAPDNNAFRKAGFNAIADINSYIDKSALASAPNYTQMRTNMDSILVNHQLLSNYNTVNPALTYLYSTDFRLGLYSVNLSNAPQPGAVFVTNINGQAVLHRQDYPQGRGAAIIAPSDITTLTGVIHRVDNLLLPTP
ncbi:fasciclin domain-containing protein [Chitinophaga dinghuensis]|uniref:Fasciclin domain-containing protein n=1 Tax=Chitinophaga dinghuensis TaxID=1539050 RepID=A0A327VZS0_9BACT|nr:fasciclin domain-containing protein [Chitinophaga dinghuensis]RAJ80254.1 fasciclin domain-containing protein [Chitinophaga dinghuensis]